MRESTMDVFDGQGPSLEGAGWFKSSRSGQDNNCVEVAFVAPRVAVRDSKDQAGPALIFPSAAWTAFLADAKSGRLDG